MTDHISPGRLLILGVFASFLISAASAQVQVSQKQLTIPTYRVNDPDPNPVFFNGRRYQGAQGRVYPYPSVHNLTEEKTAKDYNAIILENEYIEVCILPELGGRIHYAKDKGSGYHFIYHNQVIKPALVGMTGAWISGGVEWNIPHHHRATSFMPVDHLVEEHDNGGITVWLGETEWRHRTRWIVGLTLNPGSSLIETTIRVFNTTPFHQSILVWSNAAVHANEDYQVVFPERTQYATFHRKNQFSEWPVSRQVYDGEDYSKGVDISNWANHSKSTSFFEWGNHGNFVAGIDHGKKAGTVIFGNKHINPGKKLWSWGNNPHGKMWDNLLTDEDGPYIELMFGSYSDNQPDYSWMQTLETRESRFWFAPLLEMEGVKKVNKFALLDLVCEHEIVRISLNANQIMEDATILIRLDDQEVFRNQLDLQPGNTRHFSVPVNGLSDCNMLYIELQDSNGISVLAYSPEKITDERFPEPVSLPKASGDINDPDSLFYVGLRFEQFHDPYYMPRDYYTKAIALKPDHVPSLLHMGILDLKNGNFQRAKEYLERAVKRLTWNYTSPKNSDPLYYLALAEKELGNKEKAYDLFYKASWDYTFNSPSHYQMALLTSRAGKYDLALQHLQKAYATNTQSIDILSLMTILYRATGQISKTSCTINLLLSVDPLNFLAHHEAFLNSGDTGKEERLDKMMRNDQENYLELACLYEQAGFADASLNILQRYVSGAKSMESIQAVIFYHMGHHSHLLGDSVSARRFFDVAGERPYEYSFPFRFETAGALRSAVSYQENDALAWYLLGNIYYDHQPQKAIESWLRSVSLNPGVAITYRNLAFGYANYLGDFQKAAEYMGKALDLNPYDPRYYAEYDLYRKFLLVEPADRLESYIPNHDVVISDITSLFPYVKLLVINGNYKESIEIMKTHHFRRWEGGESIYKYWIYSHLFKALVAMDLQKHDEARQLLEAALSYPLNLYSIGSAYEPVVHYYRGSIASETGEGKEAVSGFEMAAGSRTGPPEARYFSAKSLEALQRNKESVAIYELLLESGVEDLQKGEALDFFDPFASVRSGDELIAEAHFKMALGYLGLGNKKMAIDSYKKAKKHNPDILSLAFYLHQ